MIWLTVKEVSKLFNISNQAINNKIKKGYFDYTKIVKSNIGRGGNSYLIALECLPQELQTKYHEMIAGNEKVSESNFNSNSASYTENQRNLAYMKKSIVQEFEVFKQSCFKTNKALLFVDEYNANHTEQNLTVNTLYAWCKLWNTNHDLADLIDTRGGKNKGITTIEDEWWEYFSSLYLTQQRRSVRLCFDETYKKFRTAATDTPFPSYYAFRRKTEKIPDAVIWRLRYGEKAFKDEVAPYIGRTTEGLDTNEIWQSDHHLCDVFVRDENDNPVRLWLTVWLDIKSRVAVNAFLRNGDPNTDTVLHSLHLAINNTGYLPQKLYTDNGKDYKAKRGLREDVPDSVSNKLGIKRIINAIAYNAQAKMIERFFNTLESQFGKTFITYAGKNAENRPEILKNVPIDKYPTIAVFTERFNIWLEEYHNVVHKGKDMQDTPHNIYQKFLNTDNYKADLEDVRNIFMKRYVRKVRQNGVTLNEIEFWNEKLVVYIGKQVTVLTEYENIQRVMIQDIEGRYICHADARPYYMYGEDMGQYEKIARERKKARKIVNEYKPKIDVDLHQEIMNRALREKQQRAQTEPLNPIKEIPMHDNVSEFPNKLPTRDEDLMTPEVLSNMLDILNKRKTANN